MHCSSSFAFFGSANCFAFITASSHCTSTGEGWLSRLRRYLSYSCSARARAVSAVMGAVPGGARGFVQVAAEGHLPQGEQDGTGGESAAAGDLPGGGGAGGEKLEYDLRPGAGAEEASEFQPEVCLGESNGKSPYASSVVISALYTG
jgi:hypothetical protein